MSWYSTIKCDPPWNDREIEHKVLDAYARNSHEYGTKLTEPRRRVFTLRRRRSEVAA